MAAVTIDTNHSDMIGALVEAGCEERGRGRLAVLSLGQKSCSSTHCAELDYYSRRLATCSSDRLIKVYDVTDNGHTFLADLPGHDGPVWQVAWSHPKFGVMLASCGYDKKVIVHRENGPGQWVNEYVYLDHESSVNSVTFAPHEYGLVIACASSDGFVSVLSHKPDGSWDASKFAPSKAGINAVTWAPYGHLGSVVEGQVVLRLATASCDNNVQVWKKVGAGEWVEEYSLSQHSEWVRDVAWAPTTGMPCNTLASCSEDRQVFIWTQNKPGESWVPTRLHVFEAPVWRVSWSFSGNVLAVSSGDQKVTLWKESLDHKWVQISHVNEVGMMTNSS